MEFYPLQTQENIINTPINLYFLSAVSSPCKRFATGLAIHSTSLQCHDTKIAFAFFTVGALGVSSTGTAKWKGRGDGGEGGEEEGEGEG